MTTLKNKSEITAKNLKEQDCEHKGKRLGFDNEENLYFIGSHFDAGVYFYETIEDLKLYV